MKLKNVFAVAVSLACMAVMSVTAYAASEVKIQGATLEDKEATLPVVFNTTDEGKSSYVASYQVVVHYDTSVWAYSDFEDVNTYGTRGKTKGVLQEGATLTDGSVELFYSCGGSNGYPTIEDGTLTLANVYLTPVDSSKTTISDSEFWVTADFIDDENTKDGDSYPADEMMSYFTFDVTGDCGGNEIVGLAVSTDGGETKADLTKYVSTTYEDGKEYADASTTFLVAFNNTKGSTQTVDVTVYGKLEDGTYVALDSYNQDDFQIQSFSN